MYNQLKVQCYFASRLLVVQGHKKFDTSHQNPERGKEVKSALFSLFNDDITIIGRKFLVCHSRHMNLSKTFADAIQISSDQYG